MATLVLHIFDEVGYTGRSVVGDVGSIVAWPAGPEEVAEWDTALEYIVCTINSIEREGLEDNLTIGVTYVNLAANVEWVVAFRLGDDVPAIFVEFLIYASFHILRLSPAFLKLDVDTGAVARILRVGNVSIAEVVNEEVHVARLSGPCLAFNGGGRSSRADFYQGLALEFVLHVIRKDAAALGIAVEHLTFGISDLVGKSADVLAVAVYYRSIFVGFPSIESFLERIVGGCERFASLLEVVFVEPATCVEHKKFGIVVVARIVAVVVTEVVVVLFFDVLFREVTWSTVLVGQ